MPFLRYYGPRRSRSPYEPKKRTRPISSYLDRISLVNKGFLIWHSTPSYRFVFLLLCLSVFVAKCILETQQHFYFLCLFFFLFSFSLTLPVFSFSSSIPKEKSQRIFSLSRKVFCERKLSCTRLDVGEILLWEQNGQSRAGSIAASGPLG